MSDIYALKSSRRHFDAYESSSDAEDEEHIEEGRGDFSQQGIKSSWDPQTSQVSQEWDSSAKMVNIGLGDDGHSGPAGTERFKLPASAFEVILVQFLSS